jgi:glycosyltransferase involved in cell wall biosynthesis
MAKQLIEILDNPILRKQMGDLGRNIALREFDVYLMVEQIDKIYQELLSRRHGYTKPRV